MMAAAWHRNSALSGASPHHSLQAARRIRQHIQQYQSTQLNLHTHIGAASARSLSSTSAHRDGVSIGDVFVPLNSPHRLTRSDLIPCGYRSKDIASDSQETLTHIKWMMQKYLLGQDIFLVGPPGPHKRQLAFRFGEVIQRELEYLSISRDTTEADLKQRAEVVHGSLHYVDQSPVRCALFGRILVLDGIEKAERNVLPTLNNLLENRELSLEDGRFLLHHTAYDALLQKGLTPAELTQRKLLRCHEDFRVIAIGLPVPRYPGYPLDPPLRSRFQARAIINLPLVSQADIFIEKYPLVDREVLMNLLSARETLRIFEAENANSALATAPTAGPNKMPHWPAVNIEHIIKVLNQLPVDMQQVYVSAASIDSVYPFTLLCDPLQCQTVFAALDRFSLHPAVRSAVDSSGAVSVVASDLTTAMPKIWVSGTPRQLHNENQLEQSEILIRTPTTITSTPEQTIQIIHKQKIIPTVIDNSNNTQLPPKDATSATPRPKYRLPTGRTIEVQLTTVNPSTGVSSVEPALVHTIHLQGAVSLDPPSSSVSSSPAAGLPEPFIPTLFHHRILAPVLLDLAVGRDVCIIGQRGCGKSSFVRWISESILGFRPHQIHQVHLFKDMSSRDLLQRRSTDQDGNTVWHTSSIIDAALTGGLAILDGVDRIPPATLQVLRRLIEDREITLFDGSRLMRHDRYIKLLDTHTPDELTQLQIYPILPSFRIIALANPPVASGSVGGATGGASGGGAWLLEETIPLFSFHQLGSMTPQAREDILTALFPNIPTPERQRVMQLVVALSTKATQTHGASPFQFSLRQCIQLLTHHAQYPLDLHDHIRRMLLHEFLPTIQKTMLDDILSSFAAAESDAPSGNTPQQLTLQQLIPRVEGGNLHIGDINYPISTRASNPELIPRILFYNIRNHLLLLQSLLKDWIVDGGGSVVGGGVASEKPFSHRRHILLIGNQGVGKNKIVDRLLELLHLERDYLQLHRDTTVQSLTLSPSLRDGRIFYDDSALVRSVKLGRTLVIDEADKAPLEVVAVLKGLVQDGQMVLSDGRRIVAQVPEGEENTGKFIQIHPEFKLIVLANRPGYPFLGNDFFRENGDVFSVHSVPNPDPDSEVTLLQSYGPSVPIEQIRQLVNVFGELRSLVIDQTFTYPYSTRECVAIVKHLERFPGDGLLVALENVLSFDHFDPTIMRNLRDVFAKHGIPLLSKGQRSGVEMEIAEMKPLPQPRLVQKWTINNNNGTTAKRSGLTTNATAGTTLSPSTPHTNFGSRLFSTLAGRMSGTGGTPSQSSSSNSPVVHPSMSSLLSSTPLTSRSWTLHLDGLMRTNESFENRRLTLFTEEKETWQIPLTSSVSRPLGMCTLGDDSIHILSSSYLSLHSYFPRLGGYSKFVSLDLEDFFPMYEIPEGTLQMVALAQTNQIVIFAPTHNMMLTIAYGKMNEESKQPNAKPTPPKCTASVMAIQPPNANKQLSAAFLEYLTPGFKMPRWNTRNQNESKDPPKSFQLLDSLSSHGILLFLQPESRFFMLLDFTSDAVHSQSTPTRTVIKGKQIDTNPTLAATKLEPATAGILSIIDLNQLPQSTHIDKLVALSPTLFLVETSDSVRYMSHGPAAGWSWFTVSADESRASGFVAHENGWFHTPVATANEIEQDRNNQPGENTSPQSANRNQTMPIPSPHAIFIPRSQVAATTPTANKSALLTPPPATALYRFGAGSLYDGATRAPADSLYEVPFPSLIAADKSTSAEATYHSWLSTLLPSSSQLAMPAYFTYHLPPPAPDAVGPWISKIDQPVISLIDLFARRIAHIPIRAHPADAPASQRARAKIGIEQLRSANTRSASSFRSRQTAIEESLDPELDAQALEESLGSAVSPSSDPINFSWSRDRVLSLKSLSTGDLVTLQVGGRVRIFEVDPIRLHGAATNWRRLFGITKQIDQPLRLELDSDRKRDAKDPKEGKVDKDNKPHVGGNTWKGGTGGSDTAGLGGKAGPYRFDAGHDVHQMKPEEKAKVSAEVAAAAKALGQKELAKRLGAIDIAPEDHALYTQYQSKVTKQIHQLRLILEQAEARQVEREWLRNQKDGDLDDSKIVDAMTGERMVYRRRGVPTAQSGALQRLPKRLHFVMDVSGSMYRFNGSDQRLERLLEATLLIMESLDGFDSKYSYSIVGHSGDSASVPFVPYGGAPKSRKERLKVLQRMYAHSQYCSSGDHTLEAIEAGIRDVAQSDADDFLTVIVSDANMRRYGIAPSQLSRALLADPRVNAYMIFVATLADEVHTLMPQLPAGRTFFCAETAQLPNLMKTILTATDIIHT